MLVTITSAVTLSSQQTEQVRSSIKKKYTQEKLEFQELVDPKVLGGLKLIIGSKNYDATLRARLDSLREQL